MSRENVEVVKALLAAFAERDFEAALACSHPEGEIRPGLVGGPEGAVYRGSDGLRQFWADINAAWSEFRVEADEFRDVGDRVIVLGRAHARGRQSGLSLTSPAAWLADMREGRVYRWQTFGSHEEALEAVELRE